MESKAYHLIKYGEADLAFELRSRMVPEPGPHDVLIEVRAFGLNFADVMARRGLYKAAPPLPAVLGYEVAGLVQETGSAVQKIKPGQKVLAFTRFGGYSQHVVTPEAAIVPIGDLDFALSTALGTQYGTALYAAYYMANLRQGESVLIHAAAGGVGTALIQLAALRNCEVIATVGSDAKKGFVLAQGARYAINYRSSNFVEEVRKIKGEKGVDVVFDPIGGRNFRQSWSLLGTGGRIVGYGASDQLNRRKGIFSMLKLAWGFGLYHPVGMIVNTRGMLGVNMLRLADEKPELLQNCLQEVMELAREGKINPVLGKVFPSQEIGAAHAWLEGRQSTGKIAITW
jgi:NADPH:quinone reductase-like Zn-dependent oxidoreductase